MEHYTLKNLALQRFGKYVSEVFRKLAILSKQYSENEFEREFVNQTCLSLEEYVHRNIPPTLANDLSDVIIRMVSSVLELHWKSECENSLMFKWDQNKRNACYGADSLDSYTTFVDESTDLAVRVSCAATHKSLTAFRYDQSSDLCFQQKYLQQMLLKTANFKQIILDKMPLTCALPHLPMLEYWCSEKVRIDVVKDVTEKSDRLKVLNLQLIKLEDFQENDNIDFILRYKNLRYLNMTGTGFSSIEARENLMQGLGSDISHSSAPRTELKSLALFLQQEDSLSISTYLPNITSLELFICHEMNLLPLKNMKHLTSLAVMSSDCMDFGLIKDLIPEIGSQLSVLKLNLVAVKFEYIATYCTQLKSFVYCFETQKECFYQIAKNFGGISNYFTSEIPTVENLELCLSGENIWEFFPYLLNCFPNFNRLKLNVIEKPQEKIVSLEESLIMPLTLGELDEFIFNDKKIEIRGVRAFITSDNGYVTTVTTEDLEDVLEKIRLGKEISEMGRHYTVIPRQTFHFSAKMMQP